MVDLAALSMVRDIVTILGVIGGFTYYVMTVRATQRNQALSLKAQEQQMETREIQILLERNDQIIKSGSLAWNDVLNMKWDNYEDFMSKYAYDGNPDLLQKRLSIWRNMNSCGIMVKDGLIKLESYIKHVGDNPPIIWEKFKDIILEQRLVFDNPDYFLGIEYLAGAVEQYRKDRGWNLKIDMYGGKEITPLP